MLLLRMLLKSQQEEENEGEEEVEVEVGELETALLWSALSALPVCQAQHSMKAQLKRQVGRTSRLLAYDDHLTLQLDDDDHLTLQPRRMRG